LQEALAANGKLEARVIQLETDLKQAMARTNLLDQEIIRLRGDLAESKKNFDNLTLDYQTLRNLNNKDLEKLKLENLSMQEKLTLFRRSVENRFAGIALTGSNVVFLLDMSGSMEYIDEDVRDPDKWPLVCETLGRVMLSLPDLKQFQVIGFANNVTFPLGR